MQTVKDNCNPVFDETFEYIISLGELQTRQLEITVLTQKTWKSPVMGQVSSPVFLFYTKSTLSKYSKLSLIQTPLKRTLLKPESH